MIEAGLPIIGALEALTRDLEEAPSSLAHHLIAEVERGRTLSQGFASWPHSFSPMIIGSIRIGENSGTLSQSLGSLSKELERREKSKQRLIAALTYPSALVAVTMGMLAFFIYYMLPRFLPLLIAGDVEIPALTQWLVNFSNSTLLKVLPFVLLGAALSCWKTKRGRHWWEKFIQTAIKLPLIGDLIASKSYSDACLQISLQLEQGVLLDDALRATSKTAWPPVVADSFAQIRQKLHGGMTLGSGLDADPYAPKLVTQMIKTGEEIGELAGFFRKTGEVLEQDYERRSEAFFQLLEPAIMLFMGLVVGAVVLACFLPIYALATDSL